MINDTPRPLLEHLIELRRRLLICLGVFGVAFVFCYGFAEPIFQFLVAPLAEQLQGRGHRQMIYTGVTEAFLTYVKVAGFAGLFLAFPIIAQQIWQFIAPGLYHQERKVFLGLVTVTPLLFLMGAAFAYYLVFPRAYAFFLSFEAPAAPLPMVLEAKINEYMGFVMRLILAFGICFELPVLLTLLAWAGFLSSRNLIGRWRIAIVVIFTVAAIVTPPDIFSMIALAIPLIALYGLSILMVKAVEMKRQNQEHTYA